MAVFTAGFGLILALLAYYNFIRFNNIFETGRTIGNASAFYYGVFVIPWQGLWGLLFSPGKGLFVFCPAIILSAIIWITFHKQYRFLSSTILAAAALRLVFIATRSDWHGGFSLGPRYMVMLIPFLMLPIGVWINTMLQKKDVRGLCTFAIVSLLCIAQQLYFSVGEIFSFLHIMKKNAVHQGINVFKDNLLYLNWDLSPLRLLLKGKRGPLFLNFIEINNYALWLCLVLLSALFLCLVYAHVLKNMRSKSADAVKEKRAGNAAQ
jgi:hypothetical protein